jgi:hypothetical protein
MTAPLRAISALQEDLQLNGPAALAHLGCGRVAASGTEAPKSSRSGAGIMWMRGGTTRQCIGFVRRSSRRVLAQGSFGSFGSNTLNSAKPLVFHTVLVS